jgi:hypothetical protein
MKYRPGSSPWSDSCRTSGFARQSNVLQFVTVSSYILSFSKATVDKPLFTVVKSSFLSLFLVDTTNQNHIPLQRQECVVLYMREKLICCHDPKPGNLRLDIELHKEHILDQALNSQRSPGSKSRPWYIYIP